MADKNIKNGGIKKTVIKITVECLPIPPVVHLKAADERQANKHLNAGDHALREHDHARFLLLMLRAHQ